MYSCFTRILLVCTHILLVFTGTLLVCYSYVLVCYSCITGMYPYVTRMYSYVTRMYSYVLVCTCVLFVCYSYVLVWCFSHDLAKLHQNFSYTFICSLIREDNECKCLTVYTCFNRSSGSTCNEVLAGHLCNILFFIILSITLAWR
jgi:hypothetical protein